MYFQIVDLYGNKTNPNQTNIRLPLSRVLVTIGNYKKQLFFRDFSRNLPETTPPNTPFPANMETRKQPPYTFEGVGAITC